MEAFDPLTVALPIEEAPEKALKEVLCLSNELAAEPPIEGALDENLGLLEELTAELTVENALGLLDVLVDDTLEETDDGKENDCLVLTAEILVSSDTFLELQKLVAGLANGTLDVDAVFPLDELLGPAIEVTIRDLEGLAVTVCFCEAEGVVPVARLEDLLDEAKGLEIENFDGDLDELTVDLTLEELACELETAEIVIEVELIFDEASELALEPLDFAIGPPVKLVKELGLLLVRLFEVDRWLDEEGLTEMV